MFKYKGQTTTGTVLVAEDEPEILEDICEYFISNRLNVIRARDGAEALQMCRLHHPDAVLTDLNMPKVTGLEMIVQLRSEGNETPVVVLTGYNDKINMLNAMRLGVVDFLEKPYDFNVLLDVVGRAIQTGLAIRETEQELEAFWVVSNLTAEKRKQLKRVKLATMILRHKLSQAS